MSGPCFGVLVDMRNPGRADRSFERHHAEVLEQVVEAERLGFGSVWCSEHHCTDDGYAPSPLVVLAAMAQRAPSLHLGTNIVIAPLHHPLRLAEDAATLSCLSGGRFTLGIAGGYHEREFRAFGRSLRHRPSLMEEAVAVLRAAFTGERFDHRGRRYEIVGGQVTPRPQTPPRILMGASSVAAADRVVALADGFMGGGPPSLMFYADALERAGRPRTAGVIGGSPVWWIVAEDPEREWARVGDHALYQINKYVEWGSFGWERRFAHRDELLDAGIWRALDASAAVDAIVALLDEHPQLEDVQFFNTLPGEDVASGTARLAYVAEHVIPAVRERLAVGVRV